MKVRAAAVERFVDRDPRRFSWTDSDFAAVAKGLRLSNDDLLAVEATYRPFERRWVNAAPRLNNRMGQLPRIFPTPDATNVVIAVSTVGARNPFSVFLTRDIPDVHLWVDDTPVFPRYVYESVEPARGARVGLFDDELAGDGSRRHHNVTDHALGLYRSLDPSIEKDDVFFYVYGILHSTDYRTAYAADLKKSLPRIPRVESAELFWAFSRAGRDLAHLHTEYESIDPWPELTYSYADQFDAEHPDAYRVLKMKHPKVADPADPKGRKVDDRSRIIYNDWITIESIPERAYNYELGSRSAVAWVMESNRVRTDKSSGIVNDPNDWAAEHDDPTYILDLVGRVVAVSMRTLDIVEGLPALDL